MGSGGMAGKVLGEGAPGILTDLGVAMANLVPLAKPPIAIMQALIGVITGLDGSGFSGLPLVVRWRILSRWLRVPKLKRSARWVRLLPSGPAAQLSPGALSQWPLSVMKKLLI